MKDDGSIVQESFPSHKFNENDLPVNDRFKNLPSILIDENDPIFKCDDDKPFEQIYFDGVCKVENLKRDVNWSVQLMPDQLIKQKAIERQNKIIDSMLDQDDVDAVAVMREQRRCDRLKEEVASNRSKNKFWVQHALNELDRRSQDGEPDKPLIREKLQAKIGELS
jgi:hypothetical protein